MIENRKSRFQKPLLFIGLFVLMLVVMFFNYSKYSEIKRNGEITRANVIQYIQHEEEQIFKYSFELNNQTYNGTFSYHLAGDIAVNLPNKITIKYLPYNPDKSYPVYLLYPFWSKKKRLYQDEFKALVK